MNTFFWHFKGFEKILRERKCQPTQGTRSAIAMLVLKKTVNWSFTQIGIITQYTTWVDFIYLSGFFLSPINDKLRLFIADKPIKTDKFSHTWKMDYLFLKTPWRKHKLLIASFF